ncbi:MAG TPA: tRNA pseudouridine(38-40) synthase TruA [bacterium (Candidatus Stahlbacteria)]|nr:tRNA pseudouridine(38-40) synthase TruA [Candidatus Stahlbacteria bacterium]
MQNFKIIVEYDGRDFFGWEIQPELRTVRGEIEKALMKILDERVQIVAGARTDAGVHALAQVANFKTNKELTAEQIRNALLGLLPRDMLVKEVINVPLDFDARRDAKSRVYIYRMLSGRAPLRHHYVWEYEFPLDLDRIREAMPPFLGTHEFKSFAFKDSGKCTIKRFDVEKGGDEITFEIEADRFLHKMVRMIVGTLSWVGRGKLSKGDISSMLKGKVGKPFAAPPQGLYLKEIKY